MQSTLQPNGGNAEAVESMESITRSCWSQLNMAEKTIMTMHGKSAQQRKNVVGFCFAETGAQQHHINHVFDLFLFLFVVIFNKNKNTLLVRECLRNVYDFETTCESPVFAMQ